MNGPKNTKKNIQQYINNYFAFILIFQEILSTLI